MKRPMAIIGVGILLLFVLAVAVSGEQIAEKHKTINPQTAVEKTTTVNEPSVTTTTAVEPDPGSVFDVPEMNLSSVNQLAEADDYSIPWESINAGGGDMQSAGYQMASSVSQSVIGYSASPSYQHGIGYWYGMAQACDCGVWGDVNDDDQVNPVDVVYMVNFVYKTQDARVQPPNCPHEAGDADCNYEVNPVDVVYFVNKVYKTQDAFCDPCAD